MRRRTLCDHAARARPLLRSLPDSTDPTSVMYEQPASPRVNSVRRTCRRSRPSTGPPTRRLKRPQQLCDRLADPDAPDRSMAPRPSSLTATSTAPRPSSTRSPPQTGDKGASRCGWSRRASACSIRSCRSSTRPAICWAQQVRRTSVGMRSPLGLGRRARVRPITWRSQAATPGPFHSGRFGLAVSFDTMRRSRHRRSTASSAPPDECLTADQIAQLFRDPQGAVAVGGGDSATRSPRPSPWQPHPVSRPIRVSRRSTA